MLFGLCCFTASAAGATNATPVPNLVFSPPGSQNVTLAWDKSPSANVIGYRLYWGVTTRMYTNMINAGTNLTATVSNLLAGTTFYFAATAYNAALNESTFSNEAQYTPPTNAPPAAPQNLRVTFQMQSGLNPNGPWTNVAGATVTVTNAVDPLIPGYLYRVAITETRME